MGRSGANSGTLRRKSSIGPIAVLLPQFTAEERVSLHDVQDVAEHLQHRAILHRDHGRRSRIVAHAGHLAEDVARPHRRDRLAVGQRDRGIDRNERAAVFDIVMFVIATIVVVARQQADGKLADPAQESPFGLVLDVAQLRT